MMCRMLMCLPSQSAAFFHIQQGLMLDIAKVKRLLHLIWNLIWNSLNMMPLQQLQLFQLVLAIIICFIVQSHQCLAAINDSNTIPSSPHAQVATYLPALQLFNLKPIITAVICKLLLILCSKIFHFLLQHFALSALPLCLNNWWRIYFRHWLKVSAFSCRSAM